jgi:hypothetical protein
MMEVIGSTKISDTNYHHYYCLWLIMACSLPATHMLRVAVKNEGSNRSCKSLSLSLRVSLSVLIHTGQQQ